jgi:hypothetical protein
MQLKREIEQQNFALQTAMASIALCANPTVVESATEAVLQVYNLGMTVLYGEGYEVHIDFEEQLNSTQDRRSQLIRLMQSELNSG